MGLIINYVQRLLYLSDHLQEVMKTVLYMKDILKIIKDKKLETKNTREHFDSAKKVSQELQLEQTIEQERRNRQKTLNNLRSGQRKMKASVS